MIYGYVCKSLPNQILEKQIASIRLVYPKISDKNIYRESYTEIGEDRPKWNALNDRAKSGDTIVFESVLRMGRTPEECTQSYFHLSNRGIKLVFVKEPYINTDIYKDCIGQYLKKNGNKSLDTANQMVSLIARTQISRIFEQEEKELDTHRKKIKEGLKTARSEGKHLGRAAGTTFITKKEAPAMEIIKKNSRSFDGSLTDKECVQLTGVSMPTYYKYKNKLRKLCESDPTDIR